MKNKETQCTGCGATVTIYAGMLRDSAGNGYCKNGVFHVVKPESVELPPVAIKPPTSIRELANKIMQACIDSPTKFLGESIETILRDESVAIKPEAPLTPLEKEFLAEGKRLVGWLESLADHAEKQAKDTRFLSMREAFTADAKNFRASAKAMKSTIAKAEAVQA